MGFRNLQEKLEKDKCLRGRFKAIAYKLFSPLRIESESIFSFFQSRFLLVCSWKLSHNFGSNLQKWVLNHDSEYYQPKEKRRGNYGTHFWRFEPKWKTSHSHFITTTHVTTPFAKEDLKRAFFAEIYCLHASVPLLMYFFLILSHYLRLCNNLPNFLSPNLKLHNQFLNVCFCNLCKLHLAFAQSITLLIAFLWQLE